MFKFTVQELKEALSEVKPEGRRSLVGMYKAKAYIDLGNYLIKNNLGNISLNPIEVKLHYSYSEAKEYLNKLLYIINSQKQILENLEYSFYIHYKMTVPWYRVTYDTLEINEVLTDLNCRSNKTQNEKLLIPELIRLDELQRLKKSLREYLYQVYCKKIKFNFDEFCEKEKIDDQTKKVLKP